MDRTRALSGAELPGELPRAVADFVADHLAGGEEVCVGLSGGPDSLALTAAALAAGLSVQALIVDHGLQEGSALVAQRAAGIAADLGATPQVLTVQVGASGGPEAAARSARYAALDAARDGRPVLLAHTLDDQAETVLLGLGRGSGIRSLAGMAAWRSPWGRPLLSIRRAQTVQACADLGLEPYLDPHNADPTFTRVRVRHELMPLFDDVLHGGVAEALARTATALRRDGDALDALATERYAAFRAGDGTGPLPLAALEVHSAIASRVLRRWLIDSGATEPTARVVEAVAALARNVSGEVAIGGDARRRLVVSRVGQELTVAARPR